MVGKALKLLKLFSGYDSDSDSEDLTEVWKCKEGCSAEIEVRPDPGGPQGPAHLGSSKDGDGHELWPAGGLHLPQGPR